MTITTKRSIIALLISLVLVVSLFTIGISATESEEAGSDTSTEQTTETGDEADTNDESDTADETKEEDKKPTGSDDKKEEETEDPEVVETRTSLIVNGIIVAAIIIVLIFLYVKFHAKFNAFLRSVKSELKKIVWSSKENTRKGFLIVAIVAVSFGVALGLADFAFSSGFDELPKLIEKLFGL